MENRVSKRWLIIILLISVSFNLAFIGSFIYLHWFHPHPQPPVRNEEMRGSRPHFGPPPFERDEEIRNLRDIVLLFYLPAIPKFLIQRLLFSSYLCDIQDKCGILYHWIGHKWFFHLIS